MLKKLKIYDFIILLLMIWSLTSILGCMSADSMSDALFLYNRVAQLRTCILEGHILGIFYYNDIGGIGYGSSFFYGYLTLIPFICITNRVLFIKIFFIVSYIILYLGAKSFIKRFSKDYDFIAFLFMASPFIVTLFVGTSMYLNYFAIGISLFFLAKCIDFFRDEKSFYPASILFFLLLNTHIITSVLSFVFCLILFIKYFNKEKIKDYIQFCVFTLLICSYFLVNFLWHTKGVLNAGTAQSYFLEEYKVTRKNNLIASFFGYNMSLGIGGLSTIYLEKVRGGLIVITPLVFGIGIYCMPKTKKNFRILGVLSIISIISVHYIWMWLYSKINILIQFPTRYTAYTLIVFLIICFRNSINKKLKIFLVITSTIFSIIFPLLFNTTSLGQSNLNDIGNYIGNGEYLSDDFILDVDTFNKLSKTCKYNFINYREYMYIDINEKDNSWFTVPKLWYRGYKAETTNGKPIKLRKGYSQFVEINPANYVGTIRVYYSHPSWLYFMEVFSYTILMVGVNYECGKYISRKRKEKREEKKVV